MCRTDRHLDRPLCCSDMPVAVHTNYSSCGQGRQGSVHMTDWAFCCRCLEGVGCGTLCQVDRSCGRMVDALSTGNDGFSILSDVRSTEEVMEDVSDHSRRDMANADCRNRVESMSRDGGLRDPYRSSPSPAGRRGCETYWNGTSGGGEGGGCCVGGRGGLWCNHHLLLIKQRQTASARSVGGCKSRAEFADLQMKKQRCNDRDCGGLLLL